LTSQYNIIQNKLGINWNTVSWTDLQKPLYSGIAAALYTILRKGSNQLSWNDEQQGTFWGHNFHGGSPASNFTEQAKILDLGNYHSHAASSRYAFVYSAMGKIDFCLSFFVLTKSHCFQIF
jgi:hypothetical protein